MEDAMIRMAWWRLRNRPRWDTIPAAGLVKGDEVQDLGVIEDVDITRKGNMLLIVGGQPHIMRVDRHVRMRPAP
jgi:hypothetical protein